MFRKVKPTISKRPLNCHDVGPHTHTHTQTLTAPQYVSQSLEVRVPLFEDEIAQVPQIVTQRRLQHEQAQRIVQVEAPVPMTQTRVQHVEQTVDVQHERQHHFPVEAGRCS